MAELIKFKAIAFVIDNDIEHGHYFYEITLPDAIAKMKAKGIDPIKNIKMRISLYPWC